MAYFPFFVELSGKTGLIVGAGPVARRKIEKLLPFGPALRVVAPEAEAALEALPGVTVQRRPFRPEDLEGADFAVAAAGSAEIDAQVARLCRQAGIPVNVADGGEEGTFLFPALIRRGMLTVGVSTGGASPGAAAALRDRMAAALPEQTEDLLEYLRRARERARVLPGAARHRLLAELLERCLEAERPLTEAETEQVFHKYQTEGDRT